MNNLVFVKGGTLFINSMVIAQETENEHRSIKQLIRKHENVFSKLGKVHISNVTLETMGGRQEKTYYELNEMQATFLITLLKNNDKVLDFKLALVQEFYRMRQFILEKQTVEWQTSRLMSKKARKEEIDIIFSKLIPHAESQGSKNAGKLYMIYSKLVNMLLGIEAGQRDNLPAEYLDAIRFLERAIENVISIEVDKGTHYKEIYQICKAKCNIIKELAFLPQLKLS